MTTPTTIPLTTEIQVSKAAELALLGSILLNPDFGIQCAKECGITTASFYYGDYARLYGLLVAALERGEPIDLALLDAEAPDLIATYLDAQMSTPSHLHAAQYARVVRDKAAQRAILSQVQLIADAAYNGDASKARTIAAELAISPPDSDQELEPTGPLERHIKRDLDLGWVDRYALLMTHLTGAPFEFNRVCGLVTVATVIQRRAWLPMSFGDIFPNVYAAIIARSSVYHKSSALSKPRTLLKRAMLDNLLLSELGTSEGLLKQLATQNSGIIIRDEIGTLFASHNQKYLVTLKPDLTALYDCYPYSRRLSNDAIKVDAPYLNILGATTPTRFYEGVSFTDWADGFLARWLFVMPEGEPDFDAMTGMYTPQHDAQLGELAIQLVNLDRRDETAFILADGAHALWDAWQRQAAKDAYFYGDDVIAAIVTRSAAYALKFSIILTAINSSWGTVTADTMQTAINLADNFKASMGKLLAERTNYGISGAKLQRVFSIIKRKSTEGMVTRRVIMQYSGLRVNEVAVCVEKLLEVGAINEDKAGRSTRYVAAITGDLPIKSWK